MRRVRGQRADAAGAQPHRGEGAAPRRHVGRPQPDPRVARRLRQVPVAADRGSTQIRGVRRRRTGLRLAARRAPRSRAAPAWKRRSWTGPTTSPTRCTTSRTASTAATCGCRQLRSTTPSEREPSAPTRPRSIPASPPSDLGAVLDELLDDPALTPMHEFDGSHRSLVGLKQATSVLTGRFVAAALSATWRPPATGRCRATTRPRRAAALAGRVRAAQGHGPAIRDAPSRCRRALRPAARRSSPNSWRRCRTVAPTRSTPFSPRCGATPPMTPARLRVVIDQVASLTDPAAIAWHARLCPPGPRVI